MEVIGVTETVKKYIVNPDDRIIKPTYVIQ